jgi:DNA-binding MarR family transcriptional regulator
MEELKVLNTIEDIRAFSDPYRMQILNLFNRFDQPATVKQIADELGEVPANVHYHVKKLEKSGILHLVYTKEINGILAKYYEPTAKRFYIERQDIDPSISTAVLNETQKLITNAYSSSQKVFLENMDENDAKIFRGNMSMENLYLTEEETKEFEAYIEDFCSKHSTKSGRSNSRQYHYFSVLIKTKDNKKGK